METPVAHAAGPLLRPVTVGIDIGGHYGAQVAEFVKTRGAGCQCLKGLPSTRFGAVLARRSVTADSLESYGPEGLMLVCGNAGKASCFSRTCPWPGQGHRPSGSRRPGCRPPGGAVTVTGWCQLRVASSFLL